MEKQWLAITQAIADASEEQRIRRFRACSTFNAPVRESLTRAMLSHRLDHVLRAAPAPVQHPPHREA